MARLECPPDARALSGVRRLRKRSWTATRTSSRSTAPGAGDTTTTSTPTSRAPSSSSSSSSRQGLILLGTGAALGAVSLAVYGLDGYSRGMLVVWLAAVMTLGARVLEGEPGLTADLAFRSCSGRSVDRGLRASLPRPSLQLAGPGHYGRADDHERLTAVLELGRGRPVRREHLPDPAGAPLSRLGQRRRVAGGSTSTTCACYTPWSG